MARSFRLAALLVVSLIAWAQPVQMVQPNSSGPDVLFKLEGTVVNAQTGKPIPHALVQLFIMGTRSVLTGSEGEFSFDKLSANTVALKVEKPGFFVPGADPRIATTQTIQIGPQTGKLILKLVPESVISGEVTNDQGEPVEGAAVDALMSQIINGRRQLTWIRSSVITDEDGLFRIARLQAGRYFLSVKAQNAERRILGAQTGKARNAYPLITYFPGANDIASATPLEVAPGQHLHAQFTLVLAPAYKLSGTVSGMADFKQVSPPMIVDAMQTPLVNVTRWDSQTGTFEFPPLPSGVYMLGVSAQIDDNQSSWVKQSVTLNHDVSGFNLPLRPGVTIPVSVQAEFSRPQDNCSGTVTSFSRPYQCGRFLSTVTLTSVEASHFSYQAEAENGDPSAFTLRSVMPGRYQIHVFTMGHGYVHSARSGETDLLREELIVPAGGKVHPIEIILRDDEAKVKVHVQAEHMPEHVHILLLPEFASLEQAVAVDTYRGGDQEYSGLAPGDYQVLAFESLDSVEYQNPEVLEKYAAKIVRITLSPQATTNVTLELIREGE